MTNTEIIMQNRVFLMEQGVIKGIEGTRILWKDEDGEREIQMPEEIKTFDAWKKEGLIVQKGEHAVAKFKIWMPRKGKAKAEEEQDKDAPKGFYMKTAFFFSQNQVAAIDG